MAEADVLVIGAGMAGLACARALLERGLRVTVLEAQQRVGGRILTKHADGEIIELGAEFIHGQPEDLLALLSEAGLTLYERTGTQVEYAKHHLGVESDEKQERSFDPLEDLEHFEGKDISFVDYLDRQNVTGEDRSSAISFVEGFNAADATIASATALGAQQRAEDRIEGDRAWKIREGYDRLPEFLLDRVRSLGGTILFGAEVQAVRWSRGEILLEASTGTCTARRCVITLPLGVLQAGDVRFSPEPEGIWRAMSGMRMGQVCRFTMVFRRAFWTSIEPQPEMRSMSFLFSPEQTPFSPEQTISVWWTSLPEDSRTLTGWIGGPRSASLLAMSQDDLAHHACAALAQIFDTEPAWVWEQMLSMHQHAWDADPYARGAYSYVAVGGIDASQRMSEPVEDTLFFAGEHTDISGHWGTVHGALRSGLRAAEQILTASLSADFPRDDLRVTSGSVRRTAPEP